MNKFSVFFVMICVVLVFGCTKTATYYVMPIAEPNSKLLSSAGGDGIVLIRSVIRKHGYANKPADVFDTRSTPVVYPYQMIVEYDGETKHLGDLIKDREMLSLTYEDIHIEATSATYQIDEFNPKGFVRYQIGKCPEGVRERKVRIFLKTADDTYTDNTGYLWFVDNAYSELVITQRR